MEACYGGTDVMERSCAVALGIDINMLSLNVCHAGTLPHAAKSTYRTQLRALPCLARPRFNINKMRGHISFCYHTGTQHWRYFSSLAELPHDPLACSEHIHPSPGLPYKSQLSMMHRPENGHR